MDIAKFFADLESLKIIDKVTSLVEKTGYTKGTVSKYVNGVHKPSAAFLDKFYLAYFNKSFKEVSGATNDLLKHGGSGIEKGKDTVDCEKKYVAVLEEVSQLKSKIIELNSLLAKAEKPSTVPGIEPFLLALQEAVESQTQSFSVELNEVADKIVQRLKK